MLEQTPAHHEIGYHPLDGLAEASRTLEEQANFQGDWMVLQQQRMMSPDFRDKFERYLQRHIPSLMEGEPGRFDKATKFRPHYENQVGEFDLNMQHVYSAVIYGRAKSIGETNPPTNLGHGKIGEQGRLYSDAVTLDGKELTVRQRNIVAAHEAYHGMVDAQGSAVAEVQSGFDLDAYHAIVDNGEIHRPSYLKEPEELLARMAQLKNYYGMAAGDVFTADHLEHARGHYVNDTELNNGMSVFFRMITPNTNDRFLQLMNELPV
jgi:hypothetical protein